MDLLALQLYLHFAQDVPICYSRLAKCICTVELARAHKKHHVQIYKLPMAIWQLSALSLNCDEISSVHLRQRACSSNSYCVGGCPTIQVHS